MDERLLIALGISLILTRIIESCFYLVICKRNKKDLLLVILVNTLTNPIVVLTYWIVYWYTNWNLLFVKTVLELSAFATEGIYYKRYGQDIKKPFVFSFAANMISFFAGVLIQYLF